MTDVVERLRNLFTGWKRIDDLSEEAADEIERLRAVLLEARVILQTWVNVSDDMSADPLPKPLREIQDDEQALLICAQEWCRRMGPVTPAEATPELAWRDAIEAAAQVADWYVKMWTNGNSDQRYNDGALNTAWKIAKAIRVLAPPTPKEGG